MKALQVLLLLLILSAFLAGGAAFASLSAREVRRAEAEAQLVGELEEAADSLLAALKDDPSPEADSPSDPVWRMVSERDLGARFDSEASDMLEGQVMLHLRDVSSALNPNWVRKNVFEKTELSSLFSSGADASGLQQYREDTGFHLDITKGYRTFFDEDTLSRYFTAYGWANLNTTDEFALRRLAELRSGSASSAEAFHTRIQSALKEKRLVRKEELKSFLGEDYESLYPVVNTEPSLNVHFLDSRILKALLSYPDFAVTDSASRAVAIESSVKGGELTPGRLEELIGAQKPNRIYEYLGTTTWFWQIEAEKAGKILRLVVARIPSDEATHGSSTQEAAVFQVVEKAVLSKAVLQ